jgi:hypothetical protein
MFFLLFTLPAITLVLSWFMGRGMSWGWYILALLIGWGICGAGVMYGINSDNVLLAAIMVLPSILIPFPATLVGLAKGKLETPSPAEVTYHAYTQLSPEAKANLHKGARVFTKLGLGYLGKVLDAKGRPLAASTVRDASNML